MDEIRKALQGARALNNKQIVRSFTNDIEKAVYVDNAENRKLKRVGQTYGSKKNDDPKGDDKKPAKTGEQAGREDKGDDIKDKRRNPVKTGEQAGREDTGDDIKDKRGKRSGKNEIYREDNLVKQAATASDEALNATLKDDKADDLVKKVAKNELKSRGGDKEGKRAKESIEYRKYLADSAANAPTEVLLMLLKDETSSPGVLESVKNELKDRGEDIGEAEMIGEFWDSVFYVYNGDSEMVKEVMGDEGEMSDLINSYWDEDKGGDIREIWDEVEKEGKKRVRRALRESKERERQE